MSENSLALQRATVTLADGRRLDVEVGNPDMVRWDVTAAKHKWPAMKDAPMLWATFVTWRAAVRSGAYAGTWEQWSNEDAMNVEMHTDDDEDTSVPPTPSGAAPDSV